MSLDTPARIAILGAGPIGLEAALYARFLGYDVDVYERGREAENVLQWGHVRLFTPFGLNRSALGLSALSAQDEEWRPPADDAFLTGRELREQYWLPLAQSDLLADYIHEQTEVLAVGREGLLKMDLAGAPDREEPELRLLLKQRGSQGAAATERIATADAVIDCTGVYGHPNWLGLGGLPALGELNAAAHIEYGLPDILGAEREKYAHQHTLVVGGGASAATSVVALEELARQAPYTTATWLTRGANPSPAGPLQMAENDPLPARSRLFQAANRAAGGGHVTHHAQTFVEAIEYRADPCCFTVRLGGRHAGEIQAQRIIASVGYRPGRSLYSELQVSESPITGGPAALGALLAESRAAGMLDPPTHGAELLNTGEPDFYILGAKSFGRDSRFLISTGLAQIRALFAVIADRPDLDLYAARAPLG